MLLEPRPRERAIAIQRRVPRVLLDRLRVQVRRAVEVVCCRRAIASRFSPTHATAIECARAYALRRSSAPLNAAFASALKAVAAALSASETSWMCSSESSGEGGIVVTLLVGEGGAEAAGELAEEDEALMLDAVDRRAV